MPTETRPATDKDVERFGAGCRRVISKSQLLEVSCVPIPANQEAIATSVSKGLLTQDQADKMFGKIEPKAADPDPEEPKDDTDKATKSTCEECGCEYEGEECPDCAEEEDDEKKAVQTVVAAVDLAEKNAGDDSVCIVHRVIDMPVAKSRDTEKFVRQLVIAEVAKKQGRAYLK